MHKKFWMPAIAAAFMLSLGTAWGGTDVSAPGGGPIATSGSNLEFFASVGGTVDASWNGVNVDFDSANTITIGQSGSSGQTLTWNLGNVDFNVAGTLAITNSLGATGQGTTVNVATLDLIAGGTINLVAGANDTDGVNKLVIANLNSAAAATGVTNFNVGANTLLHVQNAAPLGLGGGSAVNITLTGGEAAFDDAVTLNRGAIHASADSSLAVGGAGLTINSTNASLGANAATLNVVDTQGGSTLAAVTVDGGILDIRANGVVNVGDLILDNGAAFAASNQAGTLNAKTLTVQAWATDTAGVATKVSGLTTVAANSTYIVAGSNNEYQGGMKIENNGVLLGEAAAATTIAFGTTGTAATLEIVGGSIEAAMGQTLAVKNADIVVTSGFVGMGNMFNAANGALDFSESTLTVNSAVGVVSMDAAQGITVKSYNQQQGVVTVNSTGVGLTVKETAAIGGAATASFEVMGDNTVFEGGLEITGNGNVYNESSANASITVGAAGDGTVVLSGGSIAGTNGKTFAIKASELVITGANANALDGSAGSIDLSAVAVTVDAKDASNLPLAVGIDAANNVTLKSYTQLNGDVSVAGTTEQFIVDGPAAIGGGVGTTTFTVSDDATLFKGGVTLGDKGVLASSSTGSTVAVGDAAGGDVAMTGGASIVATSGNDLTFVDKTPGLSKFTVSGSGNEIVGSVDANVLDVTVNGSLLDTDPALRIAGAAGEAFTANSMIVNGGEVVLGNTATTSVGLLNVNTGVQVKSGGSFAVEYNDAIVTKLGGVGNAFTVDAGGSVEARGGNISLTNFDSTNIAGSYVAGWNGTTNNIAILTSDSDITLASTASVGMTSELASQAAVGTVVMTATGGKSITNNANLSMTSMFGTFGFDVVGTNSLQVSSVANKVNGDYSAGDIAQATANLRNMWGRRQFDDNLGNIIYGSSVMPYVYTAIPGNRAGEKNIDIFQSIANPTGKSVGVDTVEYVNGAYNFGVNDVAITTARHFLGEMNNRAKVVNGQFTAARDTFGSGSGLASTAMNENYANRFWMGGFGLWENADKRSGFSGYEYDSYGFIGGYDRALGCNFAVGAAFAYNNGNYEDKGAIGHDSEIQSYSAGLYATYSNPKGFFATLFGGYSYSDNDIRELRRDPTSLSGYSWSEADYHTDTWSVGTNVGWDFRPSECFTLTPSVGLNYVRANSNDHDAWLGGVMTQRERDVRNYGLFLPVELGAQYDMIVGVEGKVRLEGSVGYAYNFHQDGIKGTIDYVGITPGASASMRSRDNARHTFRTGAGVRYNYRQFDVGVKYDYTAKNDYNAHRVMGSIGISF